jgi:hypothetical protein
VLEKNVSLKTVWRGEKGFHGVCFLLCRFGGKQIHASEDDGTIKHALIRDYDGEVSRLDRFGEELEEST